MFENKKFLYLQYWFGMMNRSLVFIGIFPLNGTNSGRLINFPGLENEKFKYQKIEHKKFWKSGVFRLVIIRQNELEP